MVSNSTELAMARLRGALEAGLGMLVVDCPHVEASPEARAWVDGFVLALADSVSEKASTSAAKRMFHVTREGARWRWAEQLFLERAWPIDLPTAELARRLSRSPVSVRVAACRLGLGKRSFSRRSRTEAAAEAVAASE